MSLRSIWSAVIMSLFAQCYSGGMDTTPIYVCLKDSIQLFHNVTVANRGPVILYRNGAKDAIIANWSMQASTLHSFAEPQYKGKVSLDEHGNIWMKHVQQSDEANYYIKYEPEIPPKEIEAKIIVMVAPDSRCKPKIIRGVDTLITSPEPDGCGRPEASAYWLQKPSITAERNVIKLLPGQGAGTVYACIDSPAFRCAKNSKLSDYCTVFEDDTHNTGNNEKNIPVKAPPTPGITQTKVPVGSTMTTATLFVLISVLLILSMSILIIIIIILHKRLKGMLNKNTKLENVSDSTPLIKEEKEISSPAETSPDKECAGNATSDVV